VEILLVALLGIAFLMLIRVAIPIFRERYWGDSKKRTDSTAKGGEL
jgi:hypothetical protein